MTGVQTLLFRSIGQFARSPACAAVHRGIVSSLPPHPEALSVFCPGDVCHLCCRLDGGRSLSWLFPCLRHCFGTRTSRTYQSACRICWLSGYALIWADGGGLDDIYCRDTASPERLSSVDTSLQPTIYNVAQLRVSRTSGTFPGPDCRRMVQLDPYTFFCRIVIIIKEINQII